jgi:hypothetical protein
MNAKRRQSAKQRTAARRNWNKLVVKGAATQLLKLAQDVAYSREALRQLQHNLYALNLCVEVH